MSNVEKQGMTGLPEILTAFEQALELERELGTGTVECDRALLAPVSSATRAAPPTLEQPAARPLPSATSVAALATGGTPVVPVAATSVALPTAAELTTCTRCDLHGLGRQHVVPGQGNADSPDFMFIGEAPGADEDRQGLAFVGAAGQFLTKMIAAMGYTREQIFIANICKCRPPNNRTPNPQEMEACLPYLRRQIAAIRPKCIVLLGRTAMSGLFPTQRIRRGTWYEYEGIPTIATFHPSYIIRFNPLTDAASLRTAKLEVWNTLKLALAKLGKQPPSKK